MGQYDYKVERQRLLLEAEEWSKGVKGIHVHGLNSMWYDDRPQDTKKGSVTDISFNNGLIKRTRNGKHIHTFGIELKGDSLIDSYEQSLN